MKHRTRTPYRNRMATIQAPKPERALQGNEPSRHFSTGQDGEYEFGSEYDGAAVKWQRFERVGEAEKTRGWYCPECGSPADMGEGENVPECCARCGSTEPFEWRD